MDRAADGERLLDVNLKTVSTTLSYDDLGLSVTFHRVLIGTKTCSSC